MMMLLCAVILIGFATITHVCIERTGIDIGTRVAAILEAKSAGIGAPW
jgi:peptidoglycan/LPS O-acetylase OafA/YrhL